MDFGGEGTYFKCGVRVEGKTLHIKKNDMVYVIAGKEKGKTGKIIKILSLKKRAIVEGLNIVKRHTKQLREDEEGGIIEKESSIGLSNLLVYCERCKRGVRNRMKFLEDGSKVRCCQKCGEQLDA